jgi:hypothetical protein
MPKIWLTLFLTYFIMFALSPIIARISTIAVYVDEQFTQKFDIPAWERSYQDDHMNIRGIPIPKIREWIM